MKAAFLAVAIIATILLIRVLLCIAVDAIRNRIVRREDRP